MSDAPPAPSRSPQAGPLRLGTRGSDLALYQSRRIAAQLAEAGIPCELLIIKTRGDRDQTTPLSALGGTGVFTKALEDALLAREVDLCVHSLKDLPTVLAPGLALAAVPERVDVRDVLVVHPSAVCTDRRATGDALPLRDGARVGTSSRRRRALLAEDRPDLELCEIRGNVPTRLQKVQDRLVDATLLAKAGLDRLALDTGDLALIPLPAREFVPAPGQAALAVETRDDDPALVARIACALHDADAAAMVAAERWLLNRLEGGCTLPLGAWCEPVAEGRFVVHAALGGTDDLPRRLRRARARASSPEAAAQLAFRILGPETPAALAGVDLTALAGARVLVTRPGRGGEELCEALRFLEAVAVHRPAILFERGPGADTVVEQLAAAAPGTVVCVTSPQGADRLGAAFADQRGSAWDRLVVAAVGASTAQALARRGIPTDLLPEDGAAGGSALAIAVAATGATSAILVGPERGHPALPDGLVASGVSVERVALYETQPASEASYPSDIEYALFGSPSQVRALGAPPAAVRVVAIGAATAAALREAGCEPAAIATRPDLAGQLAALASVVG